MYNWNNDIRGLLSEPQMPEVRVEATPIPQAMPQAPQSEGIGIGDVLKGIAYGFVPNTMSAIEQFGQARGARRAAVGQEGAAKYNQLAEYWADKDPEKAAQYLEMAQSMKPKAKEAFAKEVGINPATGEAEMVIVYRDGSREFTGIKADQRARSAGSASSAPGRLPTGYMWNEEAGQAMPIPGVPQKPVGGVRRAPSGASPSAQKQVRTKPLNATEFKELAETEDVIGSSQAALSALDKALSINDQAYYGLTAKPRAVIESQIGGNPRANATIELDNLIQNQALSSMKAIFGGNPTEGERRILLDLQASAEKTPQQRAEILKRARAATAARIEKAKRKASAIRTGEFGTPAYEKSQPAPAQPRKRYNPATGKIESY